MDAPILSLEEIFERYDIEEADRDAILVTRRLDDPGDLDFREIGTAGGGQYGEFMAQDYNPRFHGTEAIRRYDEMKRSDGAVRSALRVLKMPVLAGRWYVEAADESDTAQLQAEFIWNALTKWMSVSWQQVLWEALLMLDYGHYVFEKVYDIKFWRREPRIIWKKVAPRHPLDIVSWEMDDRGGPAGIWYTDLSAPGGKVWIPISKLAVFTFEREANNMQGVSILRSAYRNWYFKDNLYKIDAIQKERHGIGIPVVVLPEGFNAKDKRLAIELARNLRTNEKAYAVLPPRFELMFARVEGQLVDPINSIEHHNRSIYENVLGQMMKLTQARVDTQADQGEDFAKSTRYIADIIRDVFNYYCIPQLIDWNWRDVRDYPMLRVRRIGETQDHRILSFALRNLVGAKAVQPDDRLEEWIRDELDLPKVDTESIRTVVPDVEDQWEHEEDLRDAGAGGDNVPAQAGGRNNRAGGRQGSIAGTTTGNRQGTARRGGDGSGRS